MATRRQLNQTGLFFSKDAGEGLVRIRKEDLLQLEKHLFQRYPNREWGTFFRFGFRRTSWGIAIYFIDGLWPERGDLDRQSELTKFHEDYTRRGFHAANNKNGFAIGVAHSHPVDCPVSPSNLDDDMDSYFAGELASFSNGNPYCSLIFERNDKTGLSFSGRIYDRGHWLPVKSLISIGETVVRKQSQLIPVRLQSTEPYSESTTARVQSVMGDSSKQMLSNATIGVVGCSGTGSPVIEVLARAGVGNFVLVDPDRLSPSNLERMHGSEWRHLQLDTMPHKVTLMQSLIHSINPDANVTPFVGNILHENVVDELVRCDFVVGCTDTVHGRVALEELARHHLVSAIDVGVVMNGNGGKVTDQLINISAFGDGLPCVFCRQTIDTYDMSYELMSEAERDEKERQATEAAGRGDMVDQYWKGSPRQIHTVGYLTTVGGAMIAGYVEGALTGCFGIPHPEMQFDIGRERFGFVAAPVTVNDGCNCQSQFGWGDAAKPFKNVAIPGHWSRRAIQLPSVATSSMFGLPESA